MEKGLICITAAQRAGTTALQHAIEGSGNARNFGEIFHIGEESRKKDIHSFYNYARQKELSLADSMLVDNARALAIEYLEWLKAISKSQYVLLDVKLNQWFALSPAWQYPHDRPFFLQQLLREKTLMIFLWRENLAEQVISLYISQAIGYWHNLTSEKVAGRTIEAPVAQLEKTAAQICRSEADMAEHLRHYDRKIVMRYEDLYTSDSVSRAFKKEFRGLTGIRLRRGETGKIRPNSVSKREIVSNYDEAAAAVNAVAARERRRLAAVP